MALAGALDCSTPTSASSHVCIGADSGAAASVDIAGSNADVSLHSASFASWLICCLLARLQIKGGEIQIKSTGQLHVQAGGNGKIVCSQMTCRTCL
jgi:hypothetical protein